jgi:L-2-hydroxyglutarate oxidase
MTRDSFAIIGGGIIGLATAYKLLLAQPRASVTVIEKESEVGRHQSSNNSGVLHAGLYYKPGSLKAQLAVSGIRQMVAFCKENEIPHEVCGKLVVAVSEDEVPRLKDLMDRGQKNGLEGLEWTGAEQIKEIEPHAAGLAAVRVPEEGIADYPKVCKILAGKIESLGGTIKTNAEVQSLKRTQTGWAVETKAGEVLVDKLVNCAGLHSDRIATLAGEEPTMRIFPFRGEYYSLRPDRQFLVRNLIYPVPDPSFPFLGVHFTRMIRGGIEAGPNAMMAFAREGYRKVSVNLRDTADALSFPGLWRFLGRHAAVCRDELRRTFSKDFFCASLRRLVPEVNPDDLVPGGAGVRAQAILPNGELANDFLFITRPAALHVLNAPSPGATASLAIGDEIVQRLASLN